MAYVPRPAPTRLSIEQNGDKDYSDGMSDQDVARFRAQADECRQQAERAINPLDKEAWYGWLVNGSSWRKHPRRERKATSVGGLSQALRRLLAPFGLSAMSDLSPECA
jgi:hypothetical protein